MNDSSIGPARISLSGDPPAGPRPSGPGLSIVVLTYNRRELLAECLKSLFAQSDPGTPLEILVVDDGSTDGTRDLVASLAVSHPDLRYCPQPHRGIAAARNTGIRNATFGLVAIVADDYILAPDYARTIVSFFTEYPAAQIVRFKIVAADDDFMSRVWHAYHEASVKRRLADGWEFSGYRDMLRLLRIEDKITTNHGLEAAGAAGFRREVFQRVGLFDELFARAEDTDFTVRLREAGIPIHYFPFHEVRHRYESSLRASRDVAFRSGRFRWRYYAKHNGGHVEVPSLLRRGIAMKMSVLYWGCWRARQTGSLVRFVLYLPFMLFIEATIKAGFIAEGMKSKMSAADIRREALDA
jgi:GT2 family glycosyltransferase